MLLKPIGHMLKTQQFHRKILPLNGLHMPLARLVPVIRLLVIPPLGAEAVDLVLVLLAVEDLLEVAVTRASAVDIIDK
jgi:hypothetical protein